MSYLEGSNGAHKDINQALYWLEKATENGDSDAQYNLGVIYCSNDYGLVLNLDKSIKWYIAATKTNNPKAQNNLGNFYREGLTVAKDYEIAVEMYDPSQNNGQYLMGSMYVEGVGVDQDIELGKKWIKKSADQGNAVAQERLSNLINR